MKLNEYTSTRRTRGNYTIPKSVQKSIPIDEIFADGIWRSGEVYSRMWLLSDINYTMMSDEKKREIQYLYGIVYAGIPTDCWAKFCIISQKMDEKAFRKGVLYHRANDGYDDLRAEKNRQLASCVKDKSSVIQQKYLIISTNKKSVDEARERLRQVQAHLLGSFSALGCVVTELRNNDRLRILHGFFRIGEEERFAFDLDECNKLGQDFRDAVAPDTIEFAKDHILIDDRYAKAMSIMQYPQRLDDRLISNLLAQVPYIVLAIDVVPVEIEDAFKEIENSRMKVDAEKVRFNRKSVDNLDFTATLPERTRAQNEIVEQYQKDLAERDQQMFLTLLTVAFFADTKEDLLRETNVLKTVAVNHNCRFTALNFQQEDAFNTAMPYGLRRIENMRTMVTENVAALVPFNTQEVMVPGGIYYGVNATSHELIIGSRTKLVNGNAMVIATSGGGKSMFVKQEILELYLRHPNAKFYIVDPENEYRPLVEALGGQVIDIAVDSNTFFNPLDVVMNDSITVPPHTQKSEFLLTLCQQIMGTSADSFGDKSIVDNSLRNIYREFVKSGYTAPCPTLADFWEDLLKQPHQRAQDIALGIQLYATGSMDLFAHQTNVDMNNRLICFNIQSLGGNLRTIAMLCMLEYINTRVTANPCTDVDAATWLYFDEIYLLLGNPESADYLQKSWRRFRKYNAYATGITQNLQDCLKNEIAYSMLSNSEFVCLLRQSSEIDHVVALYNLSDAQKHYLTNAQPGQGILKMGNALITFRNDHPKDTKIYKLLTTKPGERRNE